MTRAGHLEFLESELRRGSAVVVLTPKERAVFAELARANGHAVASETLIEKVWGDGPIGSESLHRCVSTLRAKLAQLGTQAQITTVYGHGYRLNMPLQKADTKPEESEAAAAESFRQAMEVVGRRSKPELETAMARLAQLRAIHPDFLPARIFSAHGEVTLALYHYDAPDAAAARALALVAPLLHSNTPSADAVSVKGFVTAVIQGDASGFCDLDSAVSIDPRNWLVRYYRAWARAGTGDFAGAIDDFEQAGAVTPAGTGLVATFAYILHCAGHSQRALSMLRDAHVLTQLSAATNAAHTFVAGALGFHDEAIAAGRRAAEVPNISATFSSALPAALAAAGRREEAAARLSEITTSGAPSMLAAVHRALGNEERARTELRRAEAEHCPYRHLQRFDPRLHGFER